MTTPNVQRFLELLGCKCRDHVTRIEGVITHVGFDLYGCIQVMLHPGQESATKTADSIWLDVNRLEVLDPKPVMPLPAFQGSDPESVGVRGLGRKPVGNGPADRPKVGGKA